MAAEVLFDLDSCMSVWCTLAVLSVGHFSSSDWHIDWANLVVSNVNKTMSPKCTSLTKLTNTSRGLQTSQSGLHPTYSAAAGPQGLNSLRLCMSLALPRWSECCTHLWRAGSQSGKIEHMDNNRVEVVAQGKLSVQSKGLSVSIKFNQSVSNIKCQNQNQQFKIKVFKFKMTD